MSDINQFDKWFEDNGPAAIIVREHLIPVEGADGVFFPATFAAQQGADRDKTKFQGGYNLDVFPDGSNVVLVDSVGSQANRIEPIFAKDGYTDLVPQIVVTFANKGIRLNLLHANHRAADAIIRCSGFENEIKEAFQEAGKGNVEKLARIAPTSLVFGVWDSRGETQAKFPRIFSSTIRAFNVLPHTRSANFLVQMTVDLAKLDIVPNAGSEEGFQNALASNVPGGVQLSHNGSIRRDISINLAAIRRLTILTPEGKIEAERTKLLRRYILSLALVSLTAPVDPFLRVGCNLVPDLDRPREFKIVGIDGTRNDFKFSHDAALAYSRSAVENFGVKKTGLEQEFSTTLADKASEVKPEKLKKKKYFLSISR
ncbi:MAG: type I-U CRISPR-associated RAMP protein Csb1/Cas7u [Zavarzinella sp.]